MPKKTTGKEVQPETVSLFGNYDDVMKRILASLDAEKNNLEHTILLKKSELRRVQDQIGQQQTQFEQWKRTETEKFNQEIAKRKNKMLEQENALRVGEDLFKHKMMEIQERERISVGLVEQRQKLNNDRIEVEKLHSSAKLMTLEAQRQLEKANSMLNQVSIREKDIKDTEVRVNNLNSTFAKREENVTIKEKDLTARLKNLEEVKSAVEPRIEELKLLEENIKKEKRESEDLRNEVAHKVEEERALIKGIEDREKKAKQKEKELLQKEEEITRKALLAGVK